jgi:leader peptidase (prepilin peptidase)/N-methyltransferase
MALGSIHTFLALIFGMLLGSFLNVCIYRLPLGKSIIHPPSSCPQCGGRIRFYDNIPVISYLLLLGRCRSCRKAISLRYPVVEITTGLLSAALFVRYAVSPQYFLLLSFCAALIVISFVDLDHQIIPDVISLPGIVLGFAVSLLPTHLYPVRWLESLIGIILGGGSLYLVGTVYEWLRGKAGMGGGDIKLLAMIGAWMGWRALPFVILLASFTGTMIGGGSLLLAGRKFSEKIPFGPFLVLGSLGYLFFENELRAFWYHYLQLK